jgi:hypothetical protein
MDITVHRLSEFGKIWSDEDIQEGIGGAFASQQEPSLGRNPAW